MVGFLADLHRHIFHVRVDVAVTHDDRDVEFIQLKREVDDIIRTARERQPVENWSCEHWAQHILDAVKNAVRVEVSEDGENGAVVEVGAPWA